MQSNLVDNLCEPLERYLRQAGIYYRIFARQKTASSIKKKLNLKRTEYLAEGRKMQDFVGIRVIFYFLEDVGIFHDKMMHMEGYDPENESNTNTDLEEITLLKDRIKQQKELKPLSMMFPLHDKIFMPQRLNLVMQIPKNLERLMESELPVDLEDADVCLIDKTYEVQLRTVLSEGWHEVEHDLRYKSRDEGWWENCREESRQLNGIYATLESSESALTQLIEGLAYKNYKSGEWDAMIRNHFRLRFNESKLSQVFVELLNHNPEISKKFFKTERRDLIKWLWEISTPIQLSTDMALCIANRKVLHEKKIFDLEPLSIKMIFERDFAE